MSTSFTSLRPSWRSEKKHREKKNKPFQKDATTKKPWGYDPRTQMTLVLLEVWAFFWRFFFLKIEDISRLPGW